LTQDNDQLWNVIDKVTKFLFSSLQLLDIRTRSEPSDDVAMLVANRFGTNQEPPILSIEPPHAGFRPAWFSGSLNGAPILHDLSQIVRMKCPLPSQPESLGL
jgi:hypothetical protein